MYILTYAVKDFAEHSNVVLGKTQKTTSADEGIT